MERLFALTVRGASVDNPYKIPDDNPMSDTPGARPEIWANGVRNPWRMSFDSQDGQLWVGDVGQRNYEEVSIVTAGANLGWPIIEGFHCFELDEDAMEQYGISTGNALQRDQAVHGTD